MAEEAGVRAPRCKLTLHQPALRHARGRYELELVVTPQGVASEKIDCRGIYLEAERSNDQRDLTTREVVLFLKNHRISTTADFLRDVEDSA